MAASVPSSTRSPSRLEYYLVPERFSSHYAARPISSSKPAPPAVDETGPGADAAASLTAPMPGTVVKVLVEEGQEVEEGQLLLVLEAMKMEQPVTAPHAGVVHSLPFDEGSLVPGGAVLAEVARPRKGASPTGHGAWPPFVET